MLMHDKWNYAPITIEINGMVIEDRYTPGVDKWIVTDIWEISAWLVNGKNSIRISISADNKHAQCWIHDITVDEKSTKE